MMQIFHKTERGIGMDWLWNIVLGVIGYVIGSLAASWPTVQIGSALFCAFPLLRRLRGYEDCFDLKGCKQVFAKTVVINSVILALVIWAVLSWAPDWMLVGAIVGYGFTFLLSLRQLGINENNVKDFVEILEKFAIQGKEDEAFHAMLDTIRW
jgi:hypothetical protein